MDNAVLAPTSDGPKTATDLLPDKLNEFAGVLTATILEMRRDGAGDRIGMVYTDVIKAISAAYTEALTAPLSE